MTPVLLTGTLVVCLVVRQGPRSCTCDDPLLQCNNNVLSIFWPHGGAFLICSKITP